MVEVAIDKIDPVGHLWLNVPSREFLVSPINEKKFRFSDAVYAIETTPKSLRKWLQNSDLKLVFSGEERGWREFSFADLAVLVTMRKLVDFGFTVDTANNFANMTLMSHERLFKYRNTPPEAVVAAFRYVKVKIWRALDDWFWRIDPDIAERPDPADAYLTLNMYDILSRLLERAKENTEEAEPIEYGAPAPLLTVDGEPAPRAARDDKDDLAPASAGGGDK
jgi:hypothetical protein